MADKMHYFRCVDGHACRRYGSETFIGCMRGPNGYTWNTDVVVAISETEMKPYRKDYNSYLRHKDLIRVDEAAYDKWIADRNQASEAHAAARTAKAADSSAANNEPQDDSKGDEPAEASGTAA